MTKEKEAVMEEVATQSAGIPNLAGVITSKDVDQKGSGSYKADYVNWARVAHILHQHAPGWQFHLRPNREGGYVHQAPDTSGYLIGYFTGPNGETTADFPQSVMDNRNNPKKWNTISARDVTDTHRRGLAAAACATFGLAWELWAKEAIEDPHQREEVTPQPVRNGSVPSNGANTAQVSPSQLNRLWAIAKEHGHDQETAKYVVNHFGFESSRDITRAKYDEVTAFLEKGVKAVEELKKAAAEKAAAKN